MSDLPKPTVPNLRARKRRDGGVPIVMVTAYDEPGARIVSEAGADIILVGDSVANTVLGYEDTLHVDIEVMAHHTAAVARAKPRSLILGDMPWMSYHVSEVEAVRNAATLVRAGAQAVKLEGGRARLGVVEAIIRAEIPVMGHLGLTPQSVLAMGLPGAGQVGRRGDGLAGRGEGAGGCRVLRLRPRGGARRRRGGGDRGAGRADDRHRGGPVVRRAGPGLSRPAGARGPGAAGAEVRSSIRVLGAAGDRGGSGVR